MAGRTLRFMKLRGRHQGTLVAEVVADTHDRRGYQRIVRKCRAPRETTEDVRCSPDRTTHAIQDPNMLSTPKGGRKAGKQRKAGERGTRRVGPYAAAPNTDNAGRSGYQRRQASASGQRGKAAASGSEQWWHKRARRRDSGGGAGGSNGGGSGVHSVISSNSVS